MLLLDKAAFPRDKPCGDGIAPHALQELDALGLPDLFADTVPICRLRLRSPTGAEAGGWFREPTRVVPREVFDARLVQAALARGAALRREKVHDVARHGADFVVNSTHRARVVIAADGANSAVRRALRIPPNPPEHCGIALRGYATGDGLHEQQIVVDRSSGPAYAWAFPTGTGIVNAGYGLVRSALGDGDGKRALRQRLASLLPDVRTDPSTLRAHHLPFSTARPDPAHGAVLLAGDAASLVNPLTGEGIYYALLSGRLAAEAAVTNPRDPGPRYRELLARTLGRHLRHTAVLARLIRHEPFVDAAVRAAARSPQVFHELVELGLGRGLIRADLVARITPAYADGWRQRVRR